MKYSTDEVVFRYALLLIGAAIFTTCLLNTTGLQPLLPNDQRSELATKASMDLQAQTSLELGQLVFQDDFDQFALDAEWESTGRAMIVKGGVTSGSGRNLELKLNHHILQRTLILELDRCRREIEVKIGRLGRYVGVLRNDQWYSVFVTDLASDLDLYKHPAVTKTHVSSSNCPLLTIRHIGKTLEFYIGDDLIQTPRFGSNLNSYNMNVTVILDNDSQIDTVAIFENTPEHPENQDSKIRPKR